MRPEELVGFLSEVRIAKAVKHVAFPVEDADAVSDVRDTALDRCRSLLADVNSCVGPLAGDFDAARFMGRPLADEFTFCGEDFDAVAFPVADDYKVVVKDGNVVREVELAVVGSGFAPRHNVVAISVHAVDARVAVAVGYEDIAGCGVDCGISWSVEHLAALAGDFLAGSDG